MKKLILLFIVFLFIWFSYSFDTIDISKYAKYNNLLNKKLDSISKTKKEAIDYKLSNIFDAKCVYWENNWFFYVSSVCFYIWKIPNLDTKETIDTIWPYIKTFDNVYDLKKTSFYYQKAEPIFYFEPINLKKYFNKSLENLILAYILTKKDIYIKIPSEYIAFNQAKNMSFYVSDKDLSKRNKSRLHNFYVALNTLDNYVLQAWETLYINKFFANKKNEYLWPWNWLFKWWVCGASTLLFRNALINPYLYVKERFNHSQRYVNFYSNYIYGDDSSVYEWDKRLKITNISKYPIYFKKKVVDNKIYLVSIIPLEVEDFVQIKKEQIWKLKAYLSSDTYDKYWNLKYKQSWTSRYNRRNYDK